MLSFRDSALCVLLTLSTLATSDLSATLDGAAPPSCDNPRILDANDTIRDTGGSVGERRCYRLDLENGGLLHLDLSDAAAAYGLDPTPVRLEVLGVHGEILGRTVREQLLQATPGTLFVIASTEDPRQPLPPYRLTSRWLDATKGEHDDELEIDPEKGEHDDELEIDPEKLVSIENPFGCGSFAKGEHDDELEIDPEKGEHDDELEIDPEKGEHDDELEIDPEKAACQELRPQIDRLCGAQALQDDVGDSLVCASAIGRSAQGTLANGWGDDADVFRFEIDRWQTVEINLRGEISVQGTLIDSEGQELGATTEDGRTARQARTLAPGTYFLRIEGEGFEGRYRVAIETLD